MNEYWKKRWIKVLRSGKYKQGTGQLKHNDLYCCLGVLCNIYNAKSWCQDRETYCYKQEEFSGTLPNGLMGKLNISNDQEGKLIDLNDDQHKSFNEIANYIEENL